MALPTLAVSTEPGGGEPSDTLHPECKLTFVTPVFNEAPSRVIRQLLSLVDQGVGDRIECILVVNNGPNDGTDAWQKQYDRNQAVLKLPIFRKTSGGADDTAATRRIREGLSVYAIDRSSDGHQTPGNNVGISRQRGLTEAARRYAQQGRNGLVVHTDADCWFDDSSFAERVIWLFDNHPDLLCIVGDYSFALEANDPESPFGIPGLLEQYKLLRRYRELYSIIRAGVVKRSRLKALGRCIIHRAAEGVAAGGIPPIHLGEDVKFGRSLEAYAAEHGLRVEHGSKWNIGTTTTLRLSARTGNDSLAQSLAMANPNGGDPVVDDAFNPGNTVVLNDAYMQRLVDAVRAMPGGERVIEWLFVTSAMARLRAN